MWSSDESDNDDAMHRDAYQRALERGSELQLAEVVKQRPAAVLQRPKEDFSRDDAAPLSQTSGSELAPPPEVDWMKDWIEAHVWQFFSDIENFHLGDLDLTGRSPSRYEKLKRKWDAYLCDFDNLAPYVSETERDRPHFDVAAQEWVDEVYTADVVTNVDVWDAFCAKWKLSPPIPYEDLVALTEHARRLIADNPQPKFQKASLADMPPEIIHAVFSHLAGQYKDAHNLTASSKFFHEIGFNYVFEFRNIVLGADDLYHVIDAKTMEGADAEVRAKMTVDRGILLDHVAFLASRPDICRRIRRLRVANNWGNAALVGTADMCLVQLNDGAMFDPVLRALGELLPRVSLTRLDLEFLPFDEALILAICAQENLMELNLKDCLVPETVQLICRGETPNSRLAPPPRSNIRYLSLTGLPYLSSFLWDSLELYPNVRSLQAVASTPSYGFMLPDDQLDWHLYAMRCLERLELYGLEPMCVPTLAAWFTERGHATALNHVKIISTSCIPVEWIDLLLRAIHRCGAPLRTLMLDGVDDREEPSALLDLIAQLFPDLEGLAVACRPSGHRESRPCVWPSPTYTYAASLRAFTGLRCFGANFDVRGADRALVAPFAALCPSLRYFVTSGARSLPQYCFLISRTATGVMSMEDKMPCVPEATPEVVRLYNPSGLLTVI